VPARGALGRGGGARVSPAPPPRPTPERAAELLQEVWERLRADPEYRPPGFHGAEQTWLAEAQTLLDNYFRLEDPRALQATRLEWWVEYELPSIHMRGVIDRLEERADGSWVLTDYKTGKVPGVTREIAAFFGLRFYALVCWRAFAVMPAEIRLVYLTDPAILTLTPTEQMLFSFERQMSALGEAIRRAIDLDDWRTRPSPFCMSCPHQARCPAWASAEQREERDGTPPT
jgi:putative RecB family exonuclease